MRGLNLSKNNPRAKATRPTIAGEERGLTPEQCRRKQGPSSVPRYVRQWGRCTPQSVPNLSCTPSCPVLSHIMSKAYLYLTNTCFPLPRLTPCAGRNGRQTSRIFLFILLPSFFYGPGTQEPMRIATSSYGLESQEPISIFIPSCGLEARELTHISISPHGLETRHLSRMISIPRRATVSKGHGLLSTKSCSEQNSTPRTYSRIQRLNRHVP